MRTLILLTTLLASTCLQAVSIDAVYFAQTHVQKAGDPYPTLVGSRDALIKAHVTDPASPASPAVSAVLTLGGSSTTINLSGPATLPASIPDGPGVVQHTAANTFTATIPAAWMAPGLTVTVNAGPASTNITNLDIGAPSVVIMNMIDIHAFQDQLGDYPAGLFEEIEAKWTVRDLQVQRFSHVVFPTIIVPPREGKPAVRITSKEDYVKQTGIAYDGTIGASQLWKASLRDAAGRAGQFQLYYVNFYGLENEGTAGDFSGVGNGTNAARGILHHELGHALSVQHLNQYPDYPYFGELHGIGVPILNGEIKGGGWHAGPTWAYDLPSNSFIPCTTQPGNEDGYVVGTYKIDPMSGGGKGSQDPGYLLNHFSDYSANRMRNALESKMVVWNESLGSYAKWNDTTKDYTNLVSNNGVQYPIARDQSVISVMAAVSGISPEVNLIYPPIGPRTAGLIRLFDPTNATDRADAQSIYGGCDLTLRVTQGGVLSTYMLTASYDPASGTPLTTNAINLPASGGEITRIEMLHTPNAEFNGLPANPDILFTWEPAQAPSPTVATFDTPPKPLDNKSITMTSTVGTFTADSNGIVEYYFTETSGNPGGDDSGWQRSPTYVDDGLQANTEYSYTVTMRSAASGAVGTPSGALSTFTLNRVGTFTICTANNGADNNWSNDTWSDGIPDGNVDVIFAEGVGIRNWAEVPAWSGTMLMEPGSSLDPRLPGGNALGGATYLIMRSAAIYDYYEENIVLPAMTIEGGSFFQSNNSFNSSVWDLRTFSGSIIGSGGFSIQGQRFMTYSFNATNPYTGGFTARSGSRYVVALNAPGSAGAGDVTVLPRSDTESLSSVLRLGADAVFNPNATLTLNGNGWNGITGGQYPNSTVRIDMRTFNATVAKLIIDGVEQAAGAYTGTSGAWITGAGTLTVTGSVYDYPAWVAANPGLNAQTAFTSDPDGDGVENGLEAYLGSDPTSGVPDGLRTLQRTSNQVTFSHPVSSNPVFKVGARYRWSDDMTHFHENMENDGNGTKVSFSAAAPVNGQVQVTATINGPVPEKMFLQLVVEQEP